MFRTLATNIHMILISSITHVDQVHATVTIWTSWGGAWFKARQGYGTPWVRKFIAFPRYFREE